MPDSGLLYKVRSATFCLCLGLWGNEISAKNYHFEDFASLSLEELLDIDVSLGVRRGESLRDSSAAVYVLTRDSIERSGATSIPELLRLVPGVEVTRFGSAKWGVGIRGFNGGIFTNRLLILVDGRSLFSPAKVGMFWDTLDTLIGDIERIEVVRGPGASLWGANAFNGVINIVTRHSADTQGGTLEVGAGNEEEWFTGYRYGVKLGNDKYLRAHIKAFQRDAASRPNGLDNRDDWHSAQAGLRYDQGAAESGAFSLQLNAYEGTEGEELLLPDENSATLQNLFFTKAEFSGLNVMAHWQHQQNDRSHYSLKFYADHSERTDSLFKLTVDSYDADFQQSYRVDSRQRIVWGLGYRYTEDKLPEQYIRYTREQRHYDVASGFLQYELSPFEQWRFIAGSKLEENDFSGSEFQPTARAIWSYSELGSTWLAVSQAKRTPSRTEHDVRIDFDYVAPQVQLQIQGSESFHSETLRAYEFGWRHQFRRGLSLDLALFFNEYEGLRTLEPGAPEPNSAPPPAFVVPVVASNGAAARSWGGELVLSAALTPQWQAELQYSNVQIDIDAERSGDPNATKAEGESPQHRLTLRSNWDLAGGWAINTALRYVDEVEGQNIDEYTELDVHLNKRFAENITLSLVGQNLLDSTHEEYVDKVVGTPRVEVERGVYVKFKLDF
ncbi:TonB-dependent receptor plug domain-containing protein [Zhongshania sp.]|uniref:TonB-dependent receptor plug domain-containing protein n=1 Tax=Zhongshania sp. TaxID=1971902 RepID=UPI00356228C3